MSTQNMEAQGLSPNIAAKNKRLMADMKRLHILRYGDPENGQISARGKPSKGELNAAAAKVTRLYHTDRVGFEEQAIKDAAAEGVETDFGQD